MKTARKTNNARSSVRKNFARIRKPKHFESKTVNAKLLRRSVEESF